jgi:hypothetical protein
MSQIAKKGGNLLTRRQAALGVCATGVLLVSAGCAVNSTEGNASKEESDLSVDNIEQLRNLSGAQGLRVYVAGFTKPADGGEGVFAYVPASRLSVVADDVGYLVKSVDGAGWWQRQTSTKDVSVKWFGAAGDGAHDDAAAVSTAAEVATRLQGRVFVPSGTYKVDGIGGRVAMANLAITTEAQGFARLSEFVATTGRTINYYPSSVN